MLGVARETVASSTELHRGPCDRHRERSQHEVAGDEVVPGHCDDRGDTEAGGGDLYEHDPARHVHVPRQV
jgi:hypothetical protein